jgi:signal transduction histidine kinase
VVAFVGAGATALVVNAAFAARFDRYLQQQQAAQLHDIGSALARAYSTKDGWNRQALDALVPSMHGAHVRVVAANGHDVWGWNGSSTSWHDAWMHGGGGGGTGSGRSGSSVSHGGGGHDALSGGTAHDGWPQSPSPHETWRDGDHQDWTTSGGSGGWSNTSMTLRDRGFVLVAAVLPSASPASSSGEAVERVPIVVHGTVVGTALVRLPEPTALPDAVAFREEVIRLLLLGGAIGALLSFALGILFARRATKPVRAATNAARALEAGDRTVRLGSARSDEFGDLGRAFDSMADAVDAEERLRQSFAGEVAHELRTPLTILRTQVEGLRVGVLEPTPEALASLDEEVQRVSRLVADLQILGSADAAGFSLERKTVDLRRVVDEQLRQFSGLFEGSEVHLEGRLEPVPAWVDPIRFGQVVANLLSNALKFTPAGGIVRVELRADEADSAVVRVADSGPGIPADELPHVFDRFFRGRTAQPPGSGIGLTVVRELVEAHGGSVAVASTHGEGTTFTVRLPVSATGTRASDHPAERPPAMVG